MFRPIRATLKHYLLWIMEATTLCKVLADDPKKTHLLGDYLLARGLCLMFICFFNFGTGLWYQYLERHGIKHEVDDIVIPHMGLVKPHYLGIPTLNQNFFRGAPDRQCNVLLGYSCAIDQA